MTTYDVDILVQSPVTVRVDAESELAAKNLALAGKGADVSGLDYTFGEVVNVRLSRWQEKR